MVSKKVNEMFSNIKKSMSQAVINKLTSNLTNNLTSNLPNNFVKQQGPMPAVGEGLEFNPTTFLSTLNKNIQSLNINAFNLANLGKNNSKFNPDKFCTEEVESETNTTIDNNSETDLD